MRRHEQDMRPLRELAKKLLRRKPKMSSTELAERCQITTRTARRWKQLHKRTAL